MGNWAAMTMDLERFVTAQDGLIDGVLAELRRGRKTGHWIWFVFPQIAGLGRSAMSERYAITTLAEARAYVEHPVLGPRLVDCCRALLAHGNTAAADILGPIDALKVRSSMTLFRAAAPGEPVFAEVLDAFYHGVADELTLARLG